MDTLTQAEQDAAQQQLTRGHKKKAKTRQALLQAALSIYAEKGVGELFLNELAEKAAVSNGTVYNYFRSREAVLEAVGIALAEQFSEQITLVSKHIENGAERVAAGIRMFIRQGRNDPVWAGAVVSVFQYDSKIRTAVANNLLVDLQLGLSQRVFHYRSESIALALVAFATTGMMAAILEGHDQPDCDITLTEMLLLGLGVHASEAQRISQLPLPQLPDGRTTPASPKRTRGRPRKSNELTG